jgi:hypothetical protein
MVKQISGQPNFLLQLIAKALSHSARADNASGRYGGRLPISVIRLYEYGNGVGTSLPALRSASFVLLAVDGLVIVDLHS